LILRIKNERRVEMAMEENRYFDIRRWTESDGDLEKTDKWVTAMYITRKDGLEGYTYTRRPVQENPRECWTNKYLKMPVPEKEVNIMLSVTGENWQNPNW